MSGTQTVPRRVISAFAGVRWERVTLPPTADRIIDRIEADATPDARHAEITRAYYAPVVISGDREGHPDRETRVAAQHVVVVSADGTVLATWRDRADEYGTATVIPRPRTEAAPPVPPPATYAALLDLLADQGVAVSRHPWGDHWRVHTPNGRPDLFIPSDPVPGDDVAADTDLLARLGVSLVSQQDRR